MFFTRVSNSVYGKRLEQIRTRHNARLTVDTQNATTWMSKLEFKDATYVKGLYIIQTYKPNIVYVRPIFLGSATLDVSKLHILKSHYGTSQTQLAGKYNLLYCL